MRCGAAGTRTSSYMGCLCFEVENKPIEPTHQALRDLPSILFCFPPLFFFPVLFLLAGLFIFFKWLINSAFYYFCLSNLLFSLFPKLTTLFPCHLLYFYFFVCLAFSCTCHHFSPCPQGTEVGRSPAGLGVEPPAHCSELLHILRVSEKERKRRGGWD